MNDYTPRQKFEIWITHAPTNLANAHLPRDPAFVGNARQCVQYLSDYAARAGGLSYSVSIRAKSDRAWVSKHELQTLAAVHELEVGS